MTRQRYEQWMTVWKWFQTQDRTAELEPLYDSLNELWQQDRLTSTPDQLASYSEKLDIEGDPDFQKFMHDLDNPETVN